MEQTPAGATEGDGSARTGVRERPAVAWSACDEKIEEPPRGLAPTGGPQRRRLQLVSQLEFWDRLLAQRCWVRYAPIAAHQAREPRLGSGLCNQSRLS